MNLSFSFSFFFSFLSFSFSHFRVFSLQVMKKKIVEASLKQDLPTQLDAEVMQIEYNDEILHNDRTLAHYGIKDNDFIYISMHRSLSLSLSRSHFLFLFSFSCCVYSLQCRGGHHCARGRIRSEHHSRWSLVEVLPSVCVCMCVCEKIFVFNSFFPRFFPLSSHFQ